MTETPQRSEAQTARLALLAATAAAAAVTSMKILSASADLETPAIKPVAVVHLTPNAAEGPATVTTSVTM